MAPRWRASTRWHRPARNSPPTRPGKDWQDLVETNYLQALVQVIKEGMIGTAAEAYPNFQVIATTHSPQLLGFLSPESRESALLIYRLTR
mgnify:CR=1 FL=1